MLLTFFMRVMVAYSYFYENETLKNIRFTGKIDRYEDVRVLLDKIGRLEVVRFEINGNCVLVKRCK